MYLKRLLCVSPPLKAAIRFLSEAALYRILIQGGRLSSHTINRYSSCAGILGTASILCPLTGFSIAGGQYFGSRPVQAGRSDRPNECAFVSQQGSAVCRNKQEFLSPTVSPALSDHHEPRHGSAFPVGEGPRSFWLRPQR